MPADQDLFDEPEIGSVEESTDDPDDLVRIIQPFDPAEIRVDTKVLSLDTLLSRIAHEEIVLQPEFQRHEVWKEDARSRLIESILIRIPLPAFYVDATDEDKWLVVDGQQRLSTLRRFVIEESLRLRGLEFLRDLTGATFAELPRSFQRRIKETNVTVYLIQKGTPSSVKINIFKRINTGGLPLSAQEIRHALNGPPVTTFLRDLAESNEFLSATRAKIPSSRMTDREYITRLLAFLLTNPAQYVAQEFDMFLNEAMAAINKMTEAERISLGDRFKHSMVLSKRILGKFAFRKLYDTDERLKPLNKALFEAWGVNLALVSDAEGALLEKRRDLLISGFMDLMRDRDFEQAITQGTGDVARVRLRFTKIAHLISETLA